MKYCAEKKAVIDIGSNTVRLVIYRLDSLGYSQEIENIKAVARLRQHLDNDNVLEQAGIEVLIDILNGFREIINFHQVKNVLCVATAAVRLAVNRNEIKNEVKKQTGFEMAILSGKEEAYYGYFAVTHTTPIEEAVAIDIGGGSTEISYFKNRKLIHSHSFPFGVVTLKKNFIHGETIKPEEKNRLQQYVKSSLQTLPWLKNLQVPIVTIGGSARNLAQIDQNLRNYPLAGIHQYSMDLLDIKEIHSIIKSLNIQQLQKLEGLSSDRADIIFPALEVFLQLGEFVGSDTFIFSRRGLRDGILLKEFAGKNDETLTLQIVKESIEKLISTYGINPVHSAHVAKLAKSIYKQIHTNSLTQDNKKCLNIIDLASRVYFIGQYIDQDVSSQHSFYLLANHSIEGLMHKDRLKLALIASFKNKNLLKQYIQPFEKWFTDEEIQEIRIAGAITKLASAMDASKRGIIKSIHVDRPFSECQMKIKLIYTANPFVERFQAEKQKHHLEKVLKNNINLQFLEHDM